VLEIAAAAGLLLAAAGGLIPSALKAANRERETQKRGDDHEQARR
jgi:hypothetical protein